MVATYLVFISLMIIRQTISCESNESEFDIGVLKYLQSKHFLLLFSRDRNVREQRVILVMKFLQFQITKS